MKYILQMADFIGTMIASCNERREYMIDPNAEYKGEFSIDERKAMTAQTIRELRRSKKLSQKEVAGYLNIPATTYNTYESGRTEPPTEILVRLSYLYKTSVDAIVQRDRTYRKADDVLKQIAEFREQLAAVDQAIEEGKEINHAALAMKNMLEALLDVLETQSQTDEAKQALSEPLQD